MSMLMDQTYGLAGRQSNHQLMLMDQPSGRVGRQASPLQSARLTLDGHRTPTRSMAYAQQVERPLMPLQVQPVQQRRLDDRLLNSYRNQDVYPAQMSQHRTVPLIRDACEDELVRRGAGRLSHASPIRMDGRISSGYVQDRQHVVDTGHVRQVSPIRMDGGNSSAYFQGGSVTIDAGYARHASPVRMDRGISSGYRQGTSVVVDAGHVRHASPIRVEGGISSSSMCDGRSKLMPAPLMGSNYAFPARGYSMGEPVPVVNHSAQYSVTGGPRLMPEVHRTLSQQSLATLPRNVDSYGLSQTGLTQTLPRAMAPSMTMAPQYSNPWQRTM